CLPKTREAARGACIMISIRRAKCKFSSLVKFRRFKRTPGASKFTMKFYWRAALSPLGVD
ncbi:hypothetical protein, partial [uncultured Campylobacter sp.]|uniref:hypothetical protein n=1 Tax=uncultured Campylobacter sp. TaxID=218934 RepID=UPI00260F6EB9